MKSTLRFGVAACMMVGAAKRLEPTKVLLEIFI
jgi:hypothetical protein